jgi:hypothetical protein
VTALFRVAAAVCYIGAALAAFGWIVGWSVDTSVGLIACGLLAGTIAAAGPPIAS